MKVIKLGGSLLETRQLFDCFKKILESDESAIVVCGGGKFANQVRDAQKKWHFDEVTAHEMAILAMQQTAIMCQNLQPDFVIFSSISEIQNHPHLIWSPTITELNAAQIPATWKITSDSLAAWLARKLHAEKLIVVKSCAIDANLTVTELTERGIVDEMFGDFVEHAIFDWSVISVKEFLAS